MIIEYPESLLKQSDDLLKGHHLTGFVAGQGPEHPKIMLIGEAPGRDESNTGIPFVGASGKELMKLVLEEKIAHGGHPVLRWMMDNIYIRTDPAGNIKPDKEKSTEKIDGAVATIMALDRAIRCGNDTSASVYDSRGILFI